MLSPVRATKFTVGPKRLVVFIIYNFVFLLQCA